MSGDHSGHSHDHTAGASSKMLAITLGQSREELRKNPATLTIVNSNSPLRLDIPMGEGLCAMARAGQPVAMTPFTLSGAMSPVTLIGPNDGNPASAAVGTSGSIGARSFEVTKSAFSFPPATWLPAEVTWSKCMSTWPPITSEMAGLLPL